MNYIPLAARIFLSLIFFNAAISHLTGFSEFVELIGSQGLPLASLLAIGTIVFQFLGAVFLVLGYKINIGSILLIIFLIPATVLFHNPIADPSQLNDFLKNIGLIGGLLMLIYAGSGALSIDGKKKDYLTKGGSKPKIVVVGAGFAGLRAVKRLSDVDASVLLIDRYNYHTFIPMLYQVATGYIEPELIAYPIRKALRNISNADFLMAEVEQIDPDNKTLIADGRTIAYDYLVLSTGSQANFLGVSGAPKFTFPLRTLENAVVLRNHILSCFERAVKHLDNNSLKEQLLTFVIVGGGPTGVEMAGALQELIRDCLVKDYPQLDLHSSKVILLQSGSSLLGSYPQHLQKYTVRALRDRGVKVHFDNRVEKTSATEVVLQDGTKIPTATIVWTAGVEASFPEPKAEVPTASKNKVEVLDTLQLPKHPHVYAVGDVAYVEQNGEPLVGIAPEALQQGGMVAENIERQLKKKAPQAFDYFNKGRAAIIARNAGVILLLGKIPLGGVLGWLMWLGIHLYYLPGISNRSKVLGAWLKDYLRRDRSVRQVYSHVSSDR